MTQQTLRRTVKWVLARLPAHWYERASGFSAGRIRLNEVRGTPVFHCRELLWENLFKVKIGESAKVLVLEFGVWEGYSIKRFASLNKNPHSILVGFDSFEGLPEDWTLTASKGAFSTSGAAPTVEDQRIRFVKGWFQNSLPQFTDEYQGLFQGATAGDYTVIVHFDADIYSSSLFLLTSLHWLLNEYFFIFDEFSGEERRAFHNYAQSYSPCVEFYGHTRNGVYPVQVTGLLRKARYGPDT